MFVSEKLEDELRMVSHHRKIEKSDLYIIYLFAVPHECTSVL